MFFEILRLRLAHIFAPAKNVTIIENMFGMGGAAVEDESYAGGKGAAVHVDGYPLHSATDQGFERLRSCCEKSSWEEERHGRGFSLEAGAASGSGEEKRQGRGLILEAAGRRGAGRRGAVSGSGEEERRT
ncbi:hypothetical protein KSP39_PZI014730 [Platanthera zijinensis]|uniref:Uncharacterized protein n=1 Tax=Platanthera zijinensis TaxID=2320716 RepID=A0AAP0G276_9ASPA